MFFVIVEETSGVSFNKSKALFPLAIGDAATSKPICQIFLKTFWSFYFFYVFRFFFLRIIKREERSAAVNNIFHGVIFKFKFVKKKSRSGLLVQ